MSESSKPIKVVHLVSSLNVGGAERFVIDLCELQKKGGLHPHIISFGQLDEPLIPQINTDLIGLTIVPAGIIKRLHTVLKIFNRMDVIHIHSPHALKSIKWLLRFCQHKTIIYTRHGAAPLANPQWLKLHKSVRPYIKAATFVSEHAKAVFMQNQCWQDLPMLTIDNGVNLLAIKLRDSNNIDGRLRLGSVGRMVALKGQINLLKAIKLLSTTLRSTIDVHFFGDGECAAELRQYSQQHLSDVSVSFHGMVNDRNAIYNQFDVLVVTSETEGLSLAIMEAMAYKKAVIATNVGGTPKLVEDKKTGYLVEYNDVQQLADTIQHCANNQTELKQIGEASYNKIKNCFSLAAAAEQYLSLYRS